MSILNKVTILYEDENVLVINKPAGLVVHGDGKTKEETLVDWILENRPEMKSVGEQLTLSNGEVIERPGIVHRIDRETSGVLLLAKNNSSFKYFKGQFKERNIRKEYHAFVYGDLPKDFETINRPIGRSKTDFRQRSVQSRARGELREAITYYEVIDRGTDTTFVRVLPKTGRTHQIRVHFKVIHHPIVADSLYAPKQPELLGFKRLALHARSLEFKNMDGKIITVEAPYPEDFAHAIDQFRASLKVAQGVPL
jgi:23S rRNA pseudouridine1911/1915/1917 synthase